MRTATALAVFLTMTSPFFAPCAARAQEPRDWTAEKCARYASAWDEARRRLSMDGVSREFIARHDAFIASGCAADVDVCPRSAREFAIADAMIIAAMNAGMASTFPPFACP